MDIEIPITIRHPQTQLETPFGVEVKPGYQEERKIILNDEAQAAIRAMLLEEYE